MDSLSNLGHMVHDSRCRCTGSGVSVLLATATVIIIGLLKEVAVPAVLAFTAAGISGWLLARKARARSRSLSVVTAVESGSLGGIDRFCQHLRQLADTSGDGVRSWPF